jgi:hypothetical protein
MANARLRPWVNACAHSLRCWVHPCLRFRLGARKIFCEVKPFLRWQTLAGGNYIYDRLGEPGGVEGGKIFLSVGPGPIRGAESICLRGHFQDFVLVRHSLVRPKRHRCPKLELWLVSQLKSYRGHPSAGRLLVSEGIGASHSWQAFLPTIMYVPFLTMPAPLVIISTNVMPALRRSWLRRGLASVTSRQLVEVTLRMGGPLELATYARHKDKTFGPYRRVHVCHVNAFPRFRQHHRLARVAAALCLLTSTALLPLPCDSEAAIGTYYGGAVEGDDTSI